MADYPSAIFVPRTTENEPGYTYDPLKTLVYFAEDYSLPAAEIVAIETTLGLNPQGSYDSVADRLDGLNVALDHGLLLGLSDDDHLQYVNKNGRTGGQDIIGDHNAGGTLNLISTDNATKGKIGFGINVTSVYDEDGDGWGFGTNSPETLVHVYRNGSGQATYVRIDSMHATQYGEAGFTIKNPKNQWWMFMDDYNLSHIGEGFLGLYSADLSDLVITYSNLGRVGIGVAAPASWLHLKAGAAAANSAPLKFNTGTNLMTPENGAVEYDGSHLYITIGGVRYQLDQQPGSGAPVGAQYVTLATDGTLTSERVLTGTANQVVITDNGAGSTVVLSLPQSIATGSSPQFTGLVLTGTLDVQGASVNFTADDEYLVTGNEAKSGAISNPSNLSLLYGSTSITATWTAAATDSLYFNLRAPNTRIGTVTKIRSVKLTFSITQTNGTVGYANTSKLFKTNKQGTETTIATLAAQNGTQTNTEVSIGSLPYTLASGEALMLQLDLTATGVISVGNIVVKTIEVVYDTD